ncbi:unnamed protein product [Schistosoma rodhaini]|nr:unnamed protein product [Schistosoma rodhaini]
MVAFIGKLHSSSIMNIIFMVITMIFMIVGVSLIMSFAKWYEMVSSISLSTVFFVSVMLINVNVHGSKRKWKILLFTMCCVFTVAGFILFVIGVTLRMNVLQGLAWICLCFIMSIVIIFTVAYLQTLSDQKQFSLLYSIILVDCEIIILVISLLFTLNTFINCKSSSGFVNQIMNGHD